MKVVLGSTEDVWTEVLPAAARYVPPKLVLFTDASSPRAESTGRGRAVLLPARFAGLPGPLFFGELDRRFGAPGDFAQAYVVAHEVGHHVQNLLGISERVHAQRSAAAPARVQPAVGARPSSRPTAWPGSGRSTPTAAASCSSPATPRRGCGGRRDWRRHAAEAARGRVVPEVVHARLVRGARALVPARDVGRPGRRLRHLRGPGPP